MSARTDLRRAMSPGPLQVDGGPPHVVHGMYAELDVVR